MPSEKRVPKRPRSPTCTSNQESMKSPSIMEEYRQNRLVVSVRKEAKQILQTAEKESDGVERHSSVALEKEAANSSILRDAVGSSNDGDSYELNDLLENCLFKKVEHILRVKELEGAQVKSNCGIGDSRKVENVAASLPTGGKVARGTNNVFEEANEGHQRVFKHGKATGDEQAAEIEQLKRKLVKQTERNDDLLSSIGALEKKLENKYNYAACEIKSLRRELSDAKQENEKMKLQIEDRDNRLDSKQTNDDLRKKIELLNTEHEKQVAPLHEEIQSLRQDISTLESEKKKALDENIRVGNMLMAQNEKIKAENRDKTEEIQRKEATIQSYKQEIQSIKRKNKEARQEINLIKAQNAFDESLLTKLKSSEKSLEENTLSLNKTIQELQSQLSILKSEKSEAETKNKAIIVTLKEDHSRQIDSLKSDFDTERIKNTELVQKKEEEIQSVKTMHEELKEMHKLQKESLDHYQKLVMQMDAMTSAQKEEMASIKNEREKEVNSLNINIAALKIQHSFLRDKLNKKEREIKSHMKRNDEQNKVPELRTKNAKRNGAKKNDLPEDKLEAEGRNPKKRKINDENNSAAMPLENESSERSLSHKYSNSDISVGERFMQWFDHHGQYYEGTVTEIISNKEIKCIYEDKNEETLTLSQIKGYQKSYGEFKSTGRSTRSGSKKQLRNKSYKCSL